MFHKIKAGSTSVILNCVIDDSSSTTGAGLTGLLFNSAGLAAKYKREGQSSWTTITLATATVGTYTSGGFIESTSGAGGEYEVHVPDAAFAAGAERVWVVLYGATNMVPCRFVVELDAVDYQDSTRFGLTALPNAAADAAGGLPISDAGGLDLDAILTDTNTLQTDWADGGRLDLILDARASQTTADAVETDTQDILSRLPAALVSGRMDADVGAIQADAITAAAIAADAIGASELAADAANEIADALLDRASAVDTKTVRQALRYMAAVLAGKVSGADSNTPLFKGLDGTTDRVQSNTDNSGNRTAVTLDP